MPRLYKQAADSRDASEGGAFERFIASAIATLVTILLSWRILLELGGSEGGGDRGLAAADEDAPETDTTGDDQRRVSGQQVSNVVLDMEAAATTPHLSASATIDTDSTPTATGGKRIGRSDRINKVYEYLNLTMPDDPEHSHKTGQDTDTQSLGDTSSEDDAVTVIEKPLLAEDQDQNATFPVETRDVTDVSRCNVGFATCAAVTSSQTCATGCERIWPELYGDRICNRDYGAPAVSCDTRPCSNVATSNTDVVIGNEIRVADDDVIVARSRSDRDNDLGQTTGETLTDNAADSSVLWPTNGDDDTTPTNGTDNNNDADIQNNTDLVFAGDSIKHAGPESCSRDTLTCSIHETPEPARVIAKLVIPEVFQRDVTSLPPPIVPRAVRDDCVSAIGGLANSNGAGRIYDFTVGPDMHIDDVKQTRDLHPRNLTAAMSSVTFVHSSDTRSSTCTGDNQRATTNVTAPGISSQETLCPGLRVLPEYIATDATGGINTSLQGRFYLTSFCDRVNNLGVYADARLSSCIEAPPNRCVFVKTEFIVHDYHIRNTNVVQFDRLTDLVDITHDPSRRSKTAALEADHKTNNMTNIGHNTNTRTQSAREECSPAAVDLYNPRCKVRRDISSTDTSAGSLFLGMGRLPNSASVELSAARPTAPGYGDIADLSAESGVHESASMTDRHQDNTKMIPESRSVWEDEKWNGKSDMFPRRHLTGGDLPAKQPPSRTPIKSDIHAMYRDDIISHKGEPTENRPVHLAWANRSTGIGDNARGIRADVAASVAGISYAGRGGPIAATVASRPTCTDRAGASLSDDGLAVSHGARPGVDSGQLSNGARSNPSSDTDTHGNDIRQQCLDNGVRNCHVTGQQCDICTLDRTVASYTPQNIVIPDRGFSVRSTNAQDTTIQGASDIPQEYYDTTDVCTLIDSTVGYSFERRADKVVNGNTHSVNTHTPSEYESGDIDIVHYATAASDTRCHDRTGTVGWVRDTSSHGHPQWTKSDANIDTAIRPATEQLQSRDIPHNAAAPDRQVSTDSTQHNSFDNVDGTPTVTSRDVDSWIRVPIPDHNTRGSKRSEKPTGFPYTVFSPTGSCHDRVTGPKSSSVTISDADGQPMSVSTGRNGNVARNPQRLDVGPAPDMHTANTEPHMAVNPEVRHAMKRNGATGSCVNVVPIVTTSARSHDNTGTRIKSILKVSPSADIDSNRRNDATRENSARAKMDIDDRFRCTHGRRNGDENTPHESRFEQSTCFWPELVTTPTRLKVFEIEYTDTAIAVSDVVNGGRCENEQLDDRPVLPFGGCSYNDAWQHERSGDLPEAGDITTSLAYDAIDPIGYRYSPDGYRRGAYGVGGGGGGGGSSVCSSVGSGTWRARSMSTLACEFFADRSSRTSLLETDLDTGEQRATPLVRETDIDYARSMTDLAHPACAPADDIMTRSLVAFPDDHATTPTELTLSANELRIRRSLSKLSVPQWYAVAATRQNRDVIRLKNVERAVASSPRRSLHISTPNIARQLTKPVVINYRVKTPLRARSPATTPTDEFELPSAKFRKQPSTWTRIETRQPPPPEGIRTSRSAREAYLRLKREQEAAKGRDCREGHLTSDVAGEAAQGRSGSTRSCRSVLTTPPGSVTEASIRSRAAGISEGARRHSGGKGSYPVMGTRINLAEFGNKSAKPDVDNAHRTSNGHHSVTFATQQPRGYHVSQHNAGRGDLSTARYDNEAKQKQMEEVLNSLLGIPPALPSNNISPLSTPLRHIPTQVTSGVADASGDDENLDVVVTCRNPKCARQASLSEARTCYKTCHNCYTYYCSRACRQTHWQRHKRRCVFSRVGSLCKNVIRRIHDDATLSAEMTRVARAGYLASGRGCVKVSFPSQAEADALLVRQDDPVTTPVFVSLAVLEDGATADEHFFELTDLCKTYNPQVKYVIDVAITAATVSDADDLPASPSRRGGESRTVSKCAKLRLHLPLSPRHTTRPEPDTLILTAVPGSELTENVAGRRARQICFVNMQRKLRQRGVSLRHQYPGVYDKLCAYVTENEHFAPITLFPLNRHTGRKFMCLIMPNSEPDVAWMHQPDLLDEIGLSTAV